MKVAELQMYYSVTCAGCNFEVTGSTLKWSYYKILWHLYFKCTDERISLWKFISGSIKLIFWKPKTI